MPATGLPLCSTPTPPTPVRPDPLAVAPARRRKSWATVGLLALVALAAYHNSFGLPFIFDDQKAIVENASIRHLWPLADVLLPPVNGSGAAGRPLANLSFALNHALSGDAVWSYHALNLLIHLAAGLTLFGLVCRTLGRPVFSAQVRAAAWPLALTVAGLWLAHPLQTESVTSIVQRTESLVGLFYLLTLYGMVRGAEADRPAGWLALSAGACLLGMAAKEVMVTAPLVVLAYDRTFVAGSLRAAWHQRRRYYLSLAATWLLLGALLLRGSGARGEGAGFGLGVSPWDYALVQCRAIPLYLRLSLWPHPLVLDYGTAVVRDWRLVLPQALVLLGLAGATAWAWWRHRPAGFAGVAFFVILAPSSSVVPLVGQTMAEHRMYLPLAALLALIVVAVFRAAPRVSWWIFGTAVLAACTATVRRNRDYRTWYGMWTDVVQKCPDNPRGHYNLANELAKLPGREADAVAQYRETLRLMPEHYLAHNNLGIELSMQPGHLDEALQQFQMAVRLQPDFSPARFNLALALFKTGRSAEAAGQLEALLARDPGYGDAVDLLRFIRSRAP